MYTFIGIDGRLIETFATLSRLACECYAGTQSWPLDAETHNEQVQGSVAGASIKGRAWKSGDQ